MLREGLVDDSLQSRIATQFCVWEVELVTKSPSQSSTLLGALSPLSPTLQLKVGVLKWYIFHLSTAFKGLFSFSATPCECESADFSMLSIAVFGGVLGVVIVTAIAVQVMVIVIFTRRLQRAKTTAVKSGQHSSVYADSQTTGLELSVSSGKNYV